MQLTRAFAVVTFHVRTESLPPRIGGTLPCLKPPGRGAAFRRDQKYLRKKYKVSTRQTM